MLIVLIILLFCLEHSQDKLYYFVNQRETVLLKPDGCLLSVTFYILFYFVFPWLFVFIVSLLWWCWGAFNRFSTGHFSFPDCFACFDLSINISVFILYYLYFLFCFVYFAYFFVCFDFLFHASILCLILHGMF